MEQSNRGYTQMSTFSERINDPIFIDIDGLLLKPSLILAIEPAKGLIAGENKSIIHYETYAGKTTFFSKLSPKEIADILADAIKT